MTSSYSQERLRSALRLVVASAGLLIFALDPSEHPLRRPFAQAVLTAFVAYSGVLYAVALRWGRYLPPALAPWLDVGWVTLLVAASEATSSVFYPLYLLAIFYASFGRGFRPGFAVVVGSVAAFALVGAVTAPGAPGAVSASYLIRPLYLLVLGYLTAVWGGSEVRSRERLALLAEVTALSNPRFGVDRTIGRTLEAIRAFHDADACVLVVLERAGEAGRRWMRTATRGSEAAREVPLPPEVASTLLDGPAGASLLLSEGRVGSRGCAPRLELLPPGGGPASAGDPALAAALAETLDAGALISVPFRYHASASGRVFVVRRRARPFDAADAAFLGQVLGQLGPVLDNLRLVDRLASDAAEEERLRIARDLHDSVIQPYLGLRLGLAAAGGALAAGRAEEGRAHVARLLELADGEIETLRRYVRELRTGGGASAGFLVAGVRRFCERFGAATGIRVDVATDGPPVQNDRLAAEVFQMIAEALSNVRRHTSAARVAVRIVTTPERLHLTVSNDAPGATAPFAPRSLSERAAALGGEARVEVAEGGPTVVHVEVPL